MGSALNKAGRRKIGVPAGPITAGHTGQGQPEEHTAVNAKQYRAALKKLGLSIIGAGPRLGIGPRQSQRYAAGDPIPETIALLLAAYLAHGLPDQDED